MALFPNDVVNITQGAYENYSHGRQNAIDCVSNTRFFAPFTGVIKHIGGTNECNGVYLESVNPVMYADGTCDYMTVLFMHDDDTSDLYEGQVIPQGQAFIDKGSAGDATGAHVHIAVYRGKYDANAVFTGSGNVYAQNAFFLLRDTVIKSGYDLSWSNILTAVLLRIIRLNIIRRSSYECAVFIAASQGRILKVFSVPEDG